MIGRANLIVCALGMLLLGSGADWRQFRGNHSDGRTTEAVPTDWTNGAPIAWTVDLPGRGLSSPIIIGDQVVVTASSGPSQERLHVLSFDARTGEKQWERQFWATGSTASHPTNSIAAPTPVSDGERIFASYSSNDVVCLDLEGNLIWYRGLGRDYPNASNSLGMASSPTVVNDVLVLMAESDADAFTAGLDIATGETRWRIQRPRQSNWTSPVVLKTTAGDASHVLLQSASGISAVEPLTGQEIWKYPDGASTIPSSVIVGDIVYVPSHGVTAIRTGRSTPAVPEIVWNDGGLRPGTSSLTAADGHLYVINSGGVLTCADQEKGGRKWQLRLGGKFSGSPVIAGGHLFIFNEDGKGFCVKLGDEAGEIVGTHELGEMILSTAAVAGKALYIRSDRHLWKIADR